MNNDALIKEARAIDKTREHWPIIKRLADALTAANAREAALRKEAAEAIEAAYKSGITETSSMPGPKIIEQMWLDSTARRAAQRIGGAE